MNLSNRKAKKIIGVISIVVLFLVNYMYLSPGFEATFNRNFPNFDKYILPLINAVINSIVSISLLLALYYIKNKNIEKHRLFILIACFFSTIFLINYVFYHMISTVTVYGGIGLSKICYLFILFTHIFCAAISFPFILLTFYLGITGQVNKHKNIARYVYPVWLYVAITGVLVYLLISPYYPQ